MGFASKLSITIVYSFALPVLLAFGELLVLKHLQDDGEVESLTCMSKDDNAALVWNEDLKESSAFEDPKRASDLRFYERNRQSWRQSPTDFSVAIPAFDPAAPRSNDVRTCTIWDETTSCVEKWNKKNDWELVNTTVRPMGPVFDYRWEGLKEHVLNKTTTYEAVEMGPQSAGSVVFSSRGTGDFHVFLCENKKPKDASCMWITLSGSDSKNSTLKSCGKGKVDLIKHQNPKDCKDIDESQNESSGTEAGIDLYEWRTFIMKWSKSTIKIFKVNDNDPFLKGTMPPALDKVSLSVRSDGDSRIRFHFYDYFMTETNNAVISTAEFIYFEKDFCAELLLGLCPDCKLNISLMDLDKEVRETWDFSGDENAIYKGLLTWRSVKLEKTFDKAVTSGRLPSLEIKTMIHEENGKGQWAIGNFRTCKSLNKIRKSTVRIPQIHGVNKPGIKAKCQKLSYDKPDLVDPEQNAIKRDSNKLVSFIREYETQFRGKHNFFGKQSSVCDNNGCICDRGLSGDDCSTECKNEFYGYNCAESCLQSCSYAGNGKRCDAKSGHCTNGCRNPRNIPPDCKKGLEPPIVTEITDTGAKISQIVEVGYGVEITVSFKLTNLNLTSSSFLSVSNITVEDYELDLKNLLSNTHYEVQTVVKVLKPVRFRTIITSRGTLFTTSCTGKPLFRIVPRETHLTVFKLIDKVCGDPEDQNYAISVEPVESGPAIPALINNTFPFEFPNLTSYTEYRVGISKNLTDTPVIFSTKIRTIEAAPGVPRQLTLHFKSHGFVKLTWQPPSTSQAAITKFVIAVNLVGTELLNPPKEKMWVFDHTVCEKLNTYNHMLSLPPSSKYEIFVSAVTINNKSSNNVTLNFTVPSSVGFERKEHKLEHSGTVIEIEYPTVVNATNNTMVSIFVDGYTSCDNVDLETGSKSVNLTNRMVANYLETDKPKGILKIGDKENNLKNCSLYIGPSYSITATVNDSNSTYSMPMGKVTLRKKNALWDLAWLIFLPILAICLYLIHLLRRKSKKIVVKQPREPSYLEILPPRPSDYSTAPQDQDFSTPRPDVADHVYSMPNDPNSRSVSSEYFEEYAKKAAESGLLMMQFMSLPTGMTRPCVYGSLPENKSKNRYQNLIAYDETRVILEKIPGDNYSNYINASFIEGYLNKRAYIATQGPKPNTVNDFWRMIWQKDVRVICMLTNIVEGSTTLSERYWPEPGTRSKYGDIEIANAERQAFADYTFRTFKLSFQHDTRKVTHLHYTGWPILGVPMAPQSLVAYLKKLRETPAGNGPVVVHCHTGDERTGTIILSDICLRRAASEGVIDVPAVTRRMREGRANMVGTPQHYLLAHILISETMMSHPTQISCEVLPKRIEKMRLQLPDDIQRLNDTMWQQQALQSFATPESAAAEEQVKLFPTFESNSSSVNAVSVDGVTMQKRYLASWLPSPFTLSHFWEFVIDKDIKLIIILQCSDPSDPTCCDIMPDESIFNPVPHIRVEAELNLDGEEHLKTEKLLLTDSSEGMSRSKSLTVLTCKGWETGKNGKPPKAGTLVSLWRASENIPRKEGQTLVLCRDGITGCGLYLALSYLLERMAVERECDVFAAVRAVRRSRPEFVKTLEQFYYLYDAAMAYSEYFQCYANFS